MKYFFTHLNVPIQYTHMIKNNSIEDTGHKFECEFKNFLATMWFAIDSKRPVEKDMVPDSLTTRGGAQEAYLLVFTYFSSFFSLSSAAQDSPIQTSP